MRKITVIGGVVLAAVLAGCGSVKTIITTATQTVTTTQTIAHRVTRTVTAQPKPAIAATSSTVAAPSSSTTSAPNTQTGSTLSVRDFNGNTLDVTADGVIAPAQPTLPGVNGPQSGTRLVALELTLKSAGPGTVSSDANSNTSVVGSDGQAYTPSFDDIVGCTNFANGSYAISGGDSERGCVVFQLPDGVKFKSAQFSLGNGTVQFNGS